MDNRIAMFKKVSFEQYYKDYVKCFGAANKELVKYVYDRIKLPKRATVSSAGHDFFAPFDIHIKPGCSIVIPTGICVSIEDGWVLKLYPRSGLGIKYRMQLDNVVGIIDGDYEYSENEGHIMAKFTNDTRDYKTIDINTGKGYMQGVFVPYGITKDDYVTEKRNGGFGSTD